MFAFVKVVLEGSWTKLNQDTSTNHDVEFDVATGWGGSDGGGRGWD